MRARGLDRFVESDGNSLLAQVSNLPPGDPRLGINFYGCAVLNLIAFSIAWRRLSRPAAATA